MIRRTGLFLMRPVWAQYAVSSGTGAEMLRTPSPRETWRSDAGLLHSVTLATGSEVDIDLVYVAGTAPAGAVVSVHEVDHHGTIVRQLAMANWSGSHMVFRIPSRRNRRVRVDFDLAAADVVELGIVAIGEAFEHPYEYGAERTLIDTTPVTDLADGGFGVGEGVVKTGYNWTFTDLSTSVYEALHNLLRTIGRSKPVVVVEHGGSWPPLPSQIHYGLLDRVQGAARIAPNRHSIGLSISEWV